MKTFIDFKEEVAVKYLRDNWRQIKQEAFHKEIDLIEFEHFLNEAYDEYIKYFEQQLPNNYNLKTFIDGYKSAKQAIQKVLSTNN